MASLLLTADPPFAAAAEDADAGSDINGLSLEELANVQISSVSKTAEPLSQAPAAVYVITHEDVIRSGATSIPEILRLAPNLQVAEVNTQTYAITARGFNGTAADKLLVLIDGRTIYSPYFSGVFWDAQDVLPEDIDRIEVISGPGATLWGANAVNGVINIITRKSADTQGGVVDIGAGNLERRASAQYGGRAGADLTYRLYASGFEHSSDLTAAQASAEDSWSKPQGGFRVDWTPLGDKVTAQGDFYNGDEREPTTPDEIIYGRNVVARWTHDLGDQSSLQVQGYYDYSAHSIATVGGDYLTTYDLDVQHSFSWTGWQDIVWGGGYRSMTDNFPTVVTAPVYEFFNPQSRTLGLWNVFVQDTMSLGKSLKLILGTKIEDDPYSGIEPLPSARLSWNVSDTNLLWAAASRAVRAPSRLDRDLFETIGNVIEVAGGNFQPETLIAYELGYRTTPTPRVNLSVSTYYDVYDDLRSLEPTRGGLPFMFGNMMEGDTYGVEAWGNYRVNDWWRLSAGADWLHENLRFKPGASGVDQAGLTGDDPHYQVSLRSSANLTNDVSLDLDLRDVGALPNPAVPSYVELGGRLGWNISQAFQVSLTGANLLQSHHVEFSSGATPVEVGRSYFVNAQWRF